MVRSGLEWNDLFVFVKLLVYRRDPNLNMQVCKYYLTVMSKLSLKEYGLCPLRLEKLGKGSIDRVWEYLEKQNKGSSLRNSISLTEINKI